MSVVTNPLIDVQLIPANIVDAFADRRLLVCGQQSAAATATSGALYENVQSNTPTEINALFGVRSDLVNSIFQCRDSSSGYVQIDVIPIDDASGSAAACTIAFAGTATADGTIKVFVVDKFQYEVTIDVLTGDEGGDVGDALVTALTALTNLPATAANVIVTTTGTVTVTSSHEGTVGMFYGVGYTGEVAGITTTTTAWASGATDPTLTGIFDVVGEERYTGILWPEYWKDEITIVSTFLETRFNSSNAIKDGIAFIGSTDTYANNNTMVDARNDRILVFVGNNTVDTNEKRGPALPKPATWVASRFMGIRAKRLTTGAPIADDIVATNGRDDNRGGPALASLPYFNTVDNACSVALADEIYSETEQRELERSGFMVFGTNQAKNGIVFGAAATPYTTDTAGNANISFHYLNYVDTGSVCREILWRASKARFAQTRLTTGDLIRRRNMDNAGSIKAYVMQIYRLLANAALLRAGTENEAYFSSELNVEIALETGTVSVTGVLPIVTQARIINYDLQYSFTTQSGQKIVF